MLERIEEIQGIGLFHAANGKKHTCHKATLIYADNGRGKSTIAAILRSVSSGDISLLTNRQTIDGTLPQKVILQFESGHKVSFDGNNWSEKRSEIQVFDSEFIERNVYSGSAISTGHRKNLLEFALGEAAVEARAAVDIATNDSKAATEKAQSLEKQLAGYHTGLSLTIFEKLQHAPNADAQLEDLQRRLNAANNVAAIMVRSIPKPVALPSYAFEPLFDDLSTSIADIHADAEKTVKQHIKKLGGKITESWLNQGKQYNDQELCPYCGQSITGNDLIMAYQTHFNASYAALKTKIAALQDTFATKMGFNIIDAFSQGLAVVKAQALAWNEQVTIHAIEFDEEKARLSLTQLREIINGLLLRKQASPAESIGTAEDLEKTKSLWQEVISCMQVSNSTVAEASAALTKYKHELTNENIEQLQQQIVRLQACKRRYEPEVVTLIGQLVTARSDAAAAEVKKKNEREKLNTLMTTTLERYQNTINALLNKFGASFTIKGMGGNFRGSGPRSEYALELRGKDVALEGRSPSFSTTLSEGDKRTLAFALFIASALEDNKLASRCLVIDDPMCSLDHTRKHHTRAVIKELYNKADQLIVLSHDLHFTRDLRDMLRKADNGTAIALFQLLPSNGTNSNFASLDIDKECETPYYQYHRILNEYLTGGNNDTKVVAKAIRPMLEGYLHRRFPNLIDKSLVFGGVVALIQNASPMSPLHYAKNLVAELNDINEYAGKFHHDALHDSATIGIVPSELRTYVDRSLNLVHKGYV